jgi:hypothetical protein
MVVVVLYGIWHLVLCTVYLTTPYY